MNQDYKTTKRNMVNTTTTLDPDTTFVPDPTTMPPLPNQKNTNDGDYNKHHFQTKDMLTKDEKEKINQLHHDHDHNKKDDDKKHHHHKNDEDHNNHKKEMEDEDMRGELTYDDKVIQKIVGVALGEVDGLLSIDGGFFSNLKDKLVNTDDVTAGIETEVGKKQVAVDMDVVVEYGKDIEKIFEEIRDVIEREVKQMTHLDVIEVNVNVVDIKTKEQYEKDSETVQDKLSDTWEDTKEFASKQTDKAKDALDKGKDKVEDAAEKGKEKVEEKTEPRVK